MRICLSLALILNFPTLFHAMSAPLPAAKLKVVPTLVDLCAQAIAADWAKIETLDEDDMGNLASYQNLSLSIYPIIARALQPDTLAIQVASLPNTGKFNHDGSRILVNPNHQPLQVLDGKTGQLVTRLEKSVTLDDSPQPSMFDFRGHSRWSPRGTRIMAHFITRMGEPNIAKIWSNAGQLLFMIPFHPCTKLFFDPSDTYLLTKRMYHPLAVFSAHDGKPLATLGAAHLGHSRVNQDPQSQWLIADQADSSTTFFDFKTFAVVKHLPGRVMQFSDDGSSIMAREEEIIPNTRDEYDEIFYSGPRTNMYWALYNRQFEKLAKIASWLHSVDLSPHARSLIYYTADHERHFDLATQQETKRFSHNNSLDTSHKVYSSFDCTKTVTLAPDGQKTAILITQDDDILTHTISCPQPLDTLFYTKNDDWVALSHYDHVAYLLNIKKGTLIPCIQETNKGLFSRKKRPLMTAEGYFMSTGGDQTALYKLPELATFADIVAILIAKKQNKRNK